MAEDEALIPAPPERSHPLDMVERVAANNDWSFERAEEDEITILVGGRWAEYQVSYSWMPEIEALHIACAFDFKIPSHRVREVEVLLPLINEQMWVGHFDLWKKEGLIMYRHAHELTGGAEISGPQCEAMMGRALNACETYFPAFQFVVWAGKSAAESLKAALFKTEGEA